MTISEFENEFQSLITDAEERLINAIRDKQNRVADKLIELISRARKGLKTNEQGRVIITGSEGRENRKLISDIKLQLFAMIDAESFTGEIQKYAGAFTALASIYLKYYSNTFRGFSSQPVKDMAKAARDRVINTVGSGRNTDFKQQVGEILDMAYQGTTASSITDRANREIRTRFRQKGRQTEIANRGHFERFVNSVVFANGSGDRAKVRDSLHGFGGAISEQVMSQTGAEFIRYGDGMVEDTRKWCKDHKGGYYHIEEVRQWASREDWEGKNPRMTRDTALIFRGGYNCIHPWLPVPTSSVPKKWIERAERKGFYEG